MNLTSAHSLRSADIAEELNQLAFASCEQAKAFEEAGRYPEAAERLGEFWRGIGVRPAVEGLERHATAELLLRAGSLTGFLGSLQQVGGAQEHAKDLIGESASLFEEAGDVSKFAEARVSLAVCYWREGALDEARVVLRDVLERIGGKDTEQEARALLGLVLVERRATRYNDALRILLEAAPLFEAMPSHAHKGRFFNQLGTVLENLGRAECRPDYTDRALIEYAAASFHFEKAGHTGFCASVENNLGFLFYTLDRYGEAHEHLERARHLFDSLGDMGRVAQVEDTLARVLLAEGKHREAARFAQSAVRRLERGGEQSLLAEALVTQGRALAREQIYRDAEAALRRALAVAETCGDLEGAGQAAITMLEELAEQLDAGEQRTLYARADEFLSRSQDSEILARLRACARKLVPAAPIRFEQHAAEKPLEPVPAFIHAAPGTAEMLQRARLVARAEGSVLLTGEPGTGKETLARMIHEWSARAGKFVTVYCAGVGDTAFGQRLFGQPATFDTDVATKTGALSEAEGGTIFFDEVGGLSPANQAMLLHLLESVDSAHGNSAQAFDVRVLASTNDNLESLVNEGLFRRDLFYRLQNFDIAIPPLRERPADIPPLAAYFIREAGRQLRKTITFAPDAVEAMSLLPLRGNAIELRSLIARTILTAEEGTVVAAEAVEIASLRGYAVECLCDPWAGFSLKDEVHRVERRFIELALREAGGKVSHAARILGFRHHESLASLLKNRHQELLSARTPARPRRRSIIKLHKR